MNAPDAVRTPTLAGQLTVQAVENVWGHLAYCPRQERCGQRSVHPSEILQGRRGVAALLDLVLEERVDRHLRLGSGRAHLEPDLGLIGHRFAASRAGRAVALLAGATDHGAVLPRRQFLDRHERIVSRVSREVNHNQPFTTADLVGDTGLEPMTSTV